jgi:hypothetical protein
VYASIGWTGWDDFLNLNGASGGGSGGCGADGQDALMAKVRKKRRTAPPIPTNAAAAAALAAAEAAKPPPILNGGRPLTFLQARAYTRTLGLRTAAAWRQYCERGNKPPNLPDDPVATYGSEWCGWGDWLDSKDKEKSQVSHRKEFLSFEEARAYVRQLGVGSAVKWRDWCRQGNRPENIPANPHVVYSKSGWRGWPDWFGTVDEAEGIQRKKPFLPFAEARALVRSLGIKSQADWNAWSQRGERPDTIPSHPERAYSSSGWVSWGDWLGKPPRRTKNPKAACATTTVSHDPVPKPFVDLRAQVRSFSLPSKDAYESLWKAMKLPAGCPERPDAVYAHTGWAGWADFLRGDVGRPGGGGCGLILAPSRPHLGLPQLPAGFPPHAPPGVPGPIYVAGPPPPAPYHHPPSALPPPQAALPRPDFLNGACLPALDFAMAKDFVRKLRLPSLLAWQQWACSPYRPPTIPPHPDLAYRSSGWAGWDDFLGAPCGDDGGGLRIMMPTSAPPLTHSSCGRPPYSMPSAGAAPTPTQPSGGGQEGGMAHPVAVPSAAPGTGGPAIVKPTPRVAGPRPVL